MDDILKELTSLSDSDLCQELKSAGLPFGGISKATRKFFEKRLATHKLKEQGLENGDENQERAPAPQESKKEDPVNNSQAAEQKQTGEPITKSDTSGGNRAASDVAGSGNLSSYVKGEIVYVVCIPVEGGQSDCGNACSVNTKIYQNQKEVLKLLKENTEARFKTFKSLEEAQNFARLQANLTTPKKVNGGASHNSEQPALTERSNSYRTPKPRQLSALRFVIEKKEVEKFKALIWDNPRYLVTSVDTPTVLHEGCKYNALHIAAMKNLPDMMELILETINDPEIPRLLYQGESEESRTGRWDFVTHLYLNSLEKGNGETPLHFASKFGFADCVRILLTHPKCNKNMSNKYGQTASEIICSRYRNNDKEKVKSVISELLGDHFYIPVWRADDNTSPAVIGEPWSPDVPNSQSPLLSEQVKGSPIDSNISLRALAGPMSPSEAVDFQKDWKTPPSSNKKKAAAIRRGDSEKGVERLGRELAHSRRVPWMEYWPFLDDFVDFSTTKGLGILEDYLATRCYELSGKKSSVTRVPAGVMKNLVSEFISTSSSNQIGVNGETLTEITNKHDVSAMGAEKDNKGGINADDMQMHSGNNPDKQFSHEQTEISADTRSTRDAKNLASELEEISLNMSNKLERNTDATEKDRSVNAGGDFSAVITVGTSGKELQSIPTAAVAAAECEQSSGTRSSVFVRNKRTSVESESKGTLDLTARPGRSPVGKPVKNSTEGETSSRIMEPVSPVGASLERTSTVGRVTNLLLSPVKMITNMMARLQLGGGKQPTGKEESDVDTGESLSPKGEAKPDVNKEQVERTVASSVASAESKLENPVNRQQNKTPADTNSLGITDVNSMCSETVPPAASERQESAPSSSGVGHGDGALTSAVTNTDSNPDPQEHTSPERTGDLPREGTLGFLTPENQRITPTPPSGASVSPESGVVFINGDAPTKADLHVLRAIEGTDVDDKFPFVKRWKQAMEEIPEEIRQRWRTPAHTRYGSPHHNGPSPSPRHQRHAHHHSPLTGGRSPVLQRLRHWSEPASRGARSRINQGGDSRGVLGRGGSPTGAGVERVPRQNLMVSAYMQ